MVLSRLYNKEAVPGGLKTGKQRAGGILDLLPPYYKGKKAVLPLTRFHLHSLNAFSSANLSCPGMGWCFHL